MGRKGLAEGVEHELLFVEMACECFRDAHMMWPRNYRTCQQ